MKWDLVELLQTKAIVHPSRITRAELTGREIEGTSCVACDLRLSLSGFPWWETKKPQSLDIQYSFLFEDLSDGKLHVLLTDGFDEALEDFSIQSLADVDWAQDQIQEIYCSAPLKDPYALYMAVEDHLIRLGAYRQPGDFLNWQQTLSQFVDLTADKSYLLARATPLVGAVITEELKRQNVSHNILSRNRSTTPSPPNLWVQFNGESFTCRSAALLLPAI